MVTVFQLASTPQMQSAFDKVQSMPGVAEELKQEVLRYKGQEAVPWKLVDAVAKELRAGAQDGSSPWMQDLCAGSKIIMESPAPRKPTPAFQQHLDGLRRKLEDKQYGDMVADITKQEREMEDMRDALLPTTRLQLSFGLHVIVTMGTFFALGYYGVRLSGGGNVAATLAGVVGLAAALVLETLLFVIRFNKPESLDSRYRHLLDTPNSGAEAREQSAASRHKRKVG